jgi:hypothetical protein
MNRFYNTTVNNSFRSILYTHIYYSLELIHEDK